MNHRLVALLLVLGGLAALVVAYWAQFILLLMPCPLCLWERWPYRVAIALGLIAMLCRPPTGRLILNFAVVALLAGVLIAGLHVGVEWQFWPSPLPECNGILTPGAPLPLTPAKPCDEATYLIPGLPISMAMMDLIYALGLALLVVTYISRKPRRFIK
ncbi:MAG: hypothetical protein B7Z75_01920 [Acidocella sp. 20-57-95]|nr:MAG: hypothetical protein B7Z75_01920 [Acidocella sp. 20-57-95]OYV62205.1 MAG: hypothetical protein B7Z71_02065 [Acidocella sp. 21-58-7]HQT63758.1 disulfide bond formation protein B [Acidocella sp.]HQU03135.1 disulfide bond formation protein B [Acidocella sp.]